MVHAHGNSKEEYSVLSSTWNEFFSSFSFTVLKKKKKGTTTFKKTVTAYMMSELKLLFWLFVLFQYIVSISQYCEQPLWVSLIKMAPGTRQRFREINK